MTGVGYDRTLLLAAVDLRDLADTELGAARGHGRQARWRCPNPEHPQTGRTPPVTITETRHGDQLWCCHGCGVGGTAIDLIIYARRTDARTAIEHLAERTGIQPTDAHTRRASTPQRPVRPAEAVEAPVPQPASRGFRRYVDECSARLETPDGAPVLDWLTQIRGLPVDVLARNQVGADIGPRQGRPWGLPIPEHPAVVFPALHGDDVVYAQIRLIVAEEDRDRWVNPTQRLATNPRVGLIHPVSDSHPGIVIVTEGVTDALSVAAAGYTAAAVLGTKHVNNPVTAAILARLPGRLVLAFDPDGAGRNATAVLPQHLAARGRPSTILELDSGDLNVQLLALGDRWPREFEQRVSTAIADVRAVSLSMAR